MYTQVDKTQESKHRSATKVVAQERRTSESTAQLLDNRSETLRAKRHGVMMNRSPQVRQLRARQETMNKHSTAPQYPIQQKTNRESEQKENKTGLPNQLKSGIENLSGYSMDDVRVHYNSDKPAQLNAHAYAQGTDIHLGSGQEKHLPHEAWHVVQQKQGRVRPTMQLKGAINVNDDAGLEREADVMGNRSLRSEPQIAPKSITGFPQQKVVQGKFASSLELHGVDNLIKLLGESNYQVSSRLSLTRWFSTEFQNDERQLNTAAEIIAAINLSNPNIIALSRAGSTSSAPTDPPAVQSPRRATHSSPIASSSTGQPPGRAAAQPEESVATSPSHVTTTTTTTTATSSHREDASTSSPTVADSAPSVLAGPAAGVFEPTHNPYNGVEAAVFRAAFEGCMEYNINERSEFALMKEMATNIMQHGVPPERVAKIILDATRQAATQALPHVPDEGGSASKLSKRDELQYFLEVTRILDIGVDTHLKQSQPLLAPPASWRILHYTTNHQPPNGAGEIRPPAWGGPLSNLDLVHQGTITGASSGHTTMKDWALFGNQAYTFYLLRIDGQVVSNQGFLKNCLYVNSYPFGAQSQIWLSGDWIGFETNLAKYKQSKTQLDGIEPFGLVSEIGLRGTPAEVYTWLYQKFKTMISSTLSNVHNLELKIPGSPLGTPGGWRKTKNHDSALKIAKGVKTNPIPRDVLADTQTEAEQ